VSECVAHITRVEWLAWMICDDVYVLMSNMSIMFYSQACRLVYYRWIC